MGHYRNIGPARAWQETGVARLRPAHTTSALTILEVILSSFSFCCSFFFRHVQSCPRGMSYARGDRVFVFFRIHKNAEGWLPVESTVFGVLSPHIAVTHGWLQARVVRDFDVSRGDKKVRIRYDHELWYQNGGRLDVSDPANAEENVDPSAVAREPSEPLLSFLVVRWGGETCDTVIGEEGGGGWGATGAVVSDLYINTLFDYFHAALPNRYQVVSAYCADSVIPGPQPPKSRLP